MVKWQRIEHCVPGVYAVSVSGELPGDIVESLKDQGKAFSLGSAALKHKLIVFNFILSV